LAPSTSVLPVELQPAPFRHQFPVGVIQLFINFVLTAASSQRCAPAVLALLEATWVDELPAPCANTGRMWILRLGLYALTCPKEKADDWVWIMDHTIRWGNGSAW
jgi:hypothetical protein